MLQTSAGLTYERPSFFEVRLTNSQTIVLCGLFPYRGDLRSMILDAKIDGSVRALTLLRELWVGHQLPKLIGSLAAGIGAVAPSLWSRVRGKADLAGVLAYDLQKAAGRPSVGFPWGAAWRIKKRSFEGSRLRRGEVPHSQPPVNTTKKERTIVVVDDVLTTGFTMESLAMKIDATEVWCIALAATPR